MPFQIGAAEVILVLVIALLVFGPKRLPGLARDAGKSLRSFKSAVEGSMPDLDAEPPRATTAGPPAPLADDEDVLEGVIVSGTGGPPRPADTSEAGGPPAT